MRDRHVVGREHAVVVDLQVLPADVVVEYLQNVVHELVGGAVVLADDAHQFAFEWVFLDQYEVAVGPGDEFFVL